MPEDACDYSAVMERLPVAGAPPDRITEILADMLREILESRHVSTDALKELLADVHPAGGAA